MARNSLSNKGPRKTGKKRSSGSDRGIVLMIAGFAVAVMLVVVLLAVISTTSG